MAAMLANPPDKEADRYTRLRQYFIDFGCTGDNLTEMQLNQHHPHPTLLCTLPGDLPLRIMVAAWYPRQKVSSNDAAMGQASALHSQSLDAVDHWADPAMLPLLYHALKAQPRRYTFVFAEISGSRDGRDFLKAIAKNSSSSPIAYIAVENLAFGGPAFAAMPPNLLPPKARPCGETLLLEAWHISQLQHIEPPRPSVSSQFVPAPILSLPPNFVPEGPRDTPRILIYSNPFVLPNQTVAASLAAFRQDHDYLAFYLAAIDRKLAESM
jgi:hypothetical protein